MRNKICLISVCFLACICNVAFAGRTWTNTPVLISGQPVSGQACALAMRSDGTWPVISYVDGLGATQTASLTPVGWQSGPSGGQMAGSRIGAATSQNGTAAFAYGNGSIMTLGQTGWSTSSYSSTPGINPGASVAFKNNNTPSVLYMGQGAQPALTLASFNGSVWSQDVVGNTASPAFFSQSYALAFDSYNQSNVAFIGGSQLMYGLKGALTTQNQWSFSTIDQANIHPDSPQMDMAIGAGDIPWIAYTQASTIQYATYDVQQQSWVHGIFDQTLGAPPGSFSMESDGLGGVGIAYVGLNNMLTYAYNDGSGWVYDIGIAQAGPFSPACNVALEFDAHNNPVICYANSMLGLSIIYDPVTIPQTASAAIIALGSALIASRRKSIRRGVRC